MSLTESVLSKSNVGVSILTIHPIHIPQAGLDDRVKDAFHEELQRTVPKIGGSESLFLCGDFIGHIGGVPAGYEGVYSGFGYCDRNTEGERILEFLVANGLVI